MLRNKLVMVYNQSIQRNDGWGGGGGFYGGWAKVEGGGVRDGI